MTDLNDAVAKAEALKDEAGQKLADAKAAEAKGEAYVVSHPVRGFLIGVACGVPIGGLLAVIPPMRSVTKAILGL